MIKLLDRAGKLYRGDDPAPAADYGAGSRRRILISSARSAPIRLTECIPRVASRVSRRVLFDYARGKSAKAFV